MTLLRDEDEENKQPPGPVKRQNTFIVEASDKSTCSSASVSGSKKPRTETTMSEGGHRSDEEVEEESLGILTPSAMKSGLPSLSSSFISEVGLDSPLVEPCKANLVSAIAKATPSPKPTKSSVRTFALDLDKIREIEAITDNDSLEGCNNVTSSQNHIKTIKDLNKVGEAYVMEKLSEIEKERNVVASDKSDHSQADTGIGTTSMPSSMISMATSAELHSDLETLGDEQVPFTQPPHISFSILL